VGGRAGRRGSGPREQPEDGAGAADRGREWPWDDAGVGGATGRRHGGALLMEVGGWTVGAVEKKERGGGGEAEKEKG
jgi:hypothetical protein